jgi:hypothetical protein
VAAGTAVGKAGDCSVEIHTDGVRDADQPGQSVAKLVFQLGRVTVSERLGDLANLLYPPPEGPIDPTRTVALPERRLDPALQLRQRDPRPLPRYRALSTTVAGRRQSPRFHVEQLLVDKLAAPVPCRQPTAEVATVATHFKAVKPCLHSGRACTLRGQAPRRCQRRSRLRNSVRQMTDLVFFLIDIAGNDVSVYPSSESLTGDLEVYDVDEGIYRVYDSHARYLPLTWESPDRGRPWSGQASLGPPRHGQENELYDVLRRFLRDIGRADLAEAPVLDLQATAQAICDHHRKPPFRLTLRWPRRRTSSSNSA